MSTEPFAESVEKIYRALPIPAETTAAPALFVISGLPGTGKSFLARRLAERLPCVIVESDFIRKTLTGAKPTYSRAESAFVHSVAHAVIQRLLEAGNHVIYDATNLAEWHREKAYHIADVTHCKLVIVRTTAPEEIVRARLARRATRHNPRELSDADWSVYELLKPEAEPVRRAHLVVDTSGEIEPALRKILRAAR